MLYHDSFYRHRHAVKTEIKTKQGDCSFTVVISCFGGSEYKKCRLILLGVDLRCNLSQVGVGLFGYMNEVIIMEISKQESVVTTYSDYKRLTNKYSLQICLNICCP